MCTKETRKAHNNISLGAWLLPPTSPAWDVQKKWASESAWASLTISTIHLSTTGRTQVLSRICSQLGTSRSSRPGDGRARRRRGARSPAPRLHTVALSPRTGNMILTLPPLLLSHRSIVDYRSCTHSAAARCFSSSTRRTYSDRCHG